MWKGPLYGYTLSSVKAERPEEENGGGDAPKVARRRGRDVARAESLAHQG